VHVVRCFEDENIAHVNDKIDPVDDIETINIELELADIEMQERAAAKKPKKGEEPAPLALLLDKPVIYALNVSEDVFTQGGDERTETAIKHIEEQGHTAFLVCAQLEEELSQLPDDERDMFLEDMGIKQSALDRLIKASYELLGLISFLTAGEKESRAWTIRSGTKAKQAAGKIHSDLERGFIRAETVAYDDLVNAGNYANAKAKGVVRLEGKDYVVQDGDVVLFRFNV
jgi:ribosome-binding ATPase YchF (GTP1/OBG family)